MKPLITNERIEVEQKGVDSYMIDNFANWFFCTNHRDAILKSEDDRRYAIFYTAQQFADDLVRDGMSGNYFPDLWGWLRDEGFSHVAYWLRTYSIRHDLNPAGGCHRAPLTSSTGDAVRESLGRAEQEIQEAIDLETPGFRNGFVSSWKVEQLLSDKNIRMSPQKRRDMMTRLGFRPLAAYDRGRSPIGIFEEDLKRPIIYSRTANGTIDDYLIAQGYGATKR
jgi:hypothetical protein